MPNPIVLPVVEPFPNKPTPKEQALKILEEAAEIVEAVKGSWNDEALDEFADTLQAMGNLAYVMGWTGSDIQRAYDRIHKSNVKRGRYE